MHLPVKNYCYLGYESEYNNCSVLSLHQEDTENHGNSGEHHEASVSPPATISINQELTDEDRWKLSEREETEVEEDVARQVLGVESSSDVEEIIDRPDH